MSGPADTTRTSQLTTARAIWRIYPFAKHAIPRISLGMVAALLGSLVALAIPWFSSAS